MAVQGTKDNFVAEVLKHKGTVLVDFWAPWCAPCRMMSETLTNYAALHPTVKIVKINVDEEPALATQYSVSSIPTLLLFKNGVFDDQSVGYLCADELEDFID